MRERSATATRIEPLRLVVGAGERAGDGGLHLMSDIAPGAWRRACGGARGRTRAGTPSAASARCLRLAISTGLSPSQLRMPSAMSSRAAENAIFARQIAESRLHGRGIGSEELGRDAVVRLPGDGVVGLMEFDLRVRIDADIGQAQAPACRRSGIHAAEPRGSRGDIVRSALHNR